MPTNLYGYGDNYHPENSHVIPALIRRFHESKLANSKSIKIWGSGKPRREFLFVDDMARASIHVMNLDEKTYALNTKPMLSHINVGKGDDVTIAELAELIGEVVGFKGQIEFDTTKPDGTLRKLMDSSRLNALGWRASVELKDGLKAVYADFLAHEVRSV